MKLTAIRRESAFLRHSTLVFASTMLVNGGAFVFYAVTGHIFNVVTYGQLYAITALLAVFLIPSTIAATVATKITAELVAAGTPRVGALVSLFSRYLGVSSVTIVALASAFRTPVGQFLHIDQAAIVPAALLIGVAIALPPFRGILQGIDGFEAYAISSGIEGVAKTVFGIVFALAGLGVAGAVGGYALGYAASFVYTAFTIRRTPVSRYRGQLEIDVARVWQTTFGAAVLTVTITLLSYADALIVKHYMPSHAAGLYAAVAVVGKILLYVVSFIPLVILPKVAKTHAQGSSPLSLLRAAALLWVALAGGGLAVIGLLPQVFIHVFVGPKFAGVAHLLLAYSAAMALLGAMAIIANYKIAIHRFDFIYPFAAVTAAELAAIALYHPSLQAVVAELFIGNLIGTLCGGYGIRPWAVPVAA